METSGNENQIENKNENQIKNQNEIELSEIEIGIENGSGIERSSFLSFLSQSSGNLVDPGSSSLGLSQDICNIVEPSSSALVSSGSSVVASDARKRPLVGDDDSAEGSARLSKLPVRRTRGVGKVQPPAPASPRVSNISRGLRKATAEWSRLAKRS